jgi:hypothetical protein
MTDPIRAALDAAARAYCFEAGECPCDTPEACRVGGQPHGASSIVAAFLRALPAGGVVVLINKRRVRVDAGLLAAAVEEAADG